MESVKIDRCACQEKSCGCAPRDAGAREEACACDERCDCDGRCACADAK